MLQLNHISIRGSKGDILQDCTYRFNEGIYVLYMNKESYRILFDCLSTYRKPEEGEITTWTDSTVYNIYSSDIFPSDLTVGEFLYSLSKINNAESNLRSALDNIPLIESVLDRRIKSLSTEEKSLLKAVVLMTVKPYINLWGGTFADDDTMERLVNVVGEFNVYIFASDDISECNRLARLYSAKRIECVDSKVVEVV